MFTETEVAYLRSQPLGRIATVSAAGQVDVAPVGYQFDGRYFYVGGRNIPATFKYKNIAAGQVKVAFVVDDLATVQPWRPRGIKVHGLADIVERDDGRPIIRIRPVKSWSWGLEGSSYRMVRRLWSPAADA